MTALPFHGWTAANQDYLAAALGDLRAMVDAASSGRAGPPPPRAPVQPEAALEQVVERFALSPFERDLLLLCAGVELDADFAALCRRAAKGEVTPGFALSVLPDAHWSALAPTGKLRYWRLIEFRPADALTTAPLRIEERVLHYLLGISHLDERLHGLVRAVPAGAELPASQQEVAEQVAALWASAGARGAAWPAVQLVGPEDAGAAAIAAAACAAHGRGLCVIDAADLPHAAAERTGFDRLWAREAALAGCGLLVSVADPDGPATVRAAAEFAGRARSAVLIACREKLRAGGAPVTALAVAKPSRPEQAALWRGALALPGAQACPAGDGAGLDRCIGELVDQFDFGPAAIAATGRFALDGAGTAPLADRLWDACRAQARGRLDDLAERIPTGPGWDDLVLPPEQTDCLHEIVAAIRHRGTVYDRWGFGAGTRRGLGVSALFAGASGTGKTLAAEVVAGALRLDLYRIDLSQVVSKYIGETEKNLQRVFDAAETAGAVLLFDEADALFGKRSEVKDSHDRYANMEVSYLLQRMETYRGLAILTTNLQQAIDPAFKRRIRFIVQFPFPDEAERAAIWRRALPPEMPAECIDVLRLARLNVAGGHIRNVALGAAFAAAEAGSAVTMAHLLRAARAEYAKLGRPFTEAETRGWA